MSETEATEHVTAEQARASDENGAAPNQADLKTPAIEDGARSMRLQEKQQRKVSL